MRLGAALLLLAAGCGGGPTPMVLGTGGRLIESPPRPRHMMLAEPPPTPAPERLPTRPFAETPITAFAESITDLALAALERRPLPPSPVPTRRPIDSDEIVEWSGFVGPRPSRLEVLAVAIEVDLILKRGEPPPDGENAARWGSLRTTLVVNRNGLRLVSLRPAVMSPDPGGGVPPAGLEGLEPIARQLIAHLRRGDVSPYDLTEQDRQLLSNDMVWREVLQDRPTHARVREVASMLVELPDAPLAYRLDDVAILTRDPEGRLYGLSLELDAQGNSFVLTVSPLLHVRRLWPQF